MTEQIKIDKDKIERVIIEDISEITIVNNGTHLCLVQKIQFSDTAHIIRLTPKQATELVHALNVLMGKETK